MKRTISAMRGPGSLNHNRRSFTAENVDPKRSSLNVMYRDEPIQKVYHELFDEAVNRYNAKQKRKDRCINDYYEHLRTGKQEKLFHELIVGKSFFMGQLAYHVAMGLPLWEYEVHQGTVLYLALEDDYARLQRRLSRMFGVEETNNLYFATQAKSVSEGLDQQLEGFIREHPDVRLIIIDTLQKVREIGGDRYSYASDYEIVTKLKTFSDRYGICLLVVHHTRKMEAEDSFDMISGTNGLLGAAKPRPQTEAPGRAQRHLLMDETSVKSAFALLSTKVTKPLPCPAPVTSTEKGRAIEKNHFRNAGPRLPQP